MGLLACHKCGAAFAFSELEKIGRRETCPKCMADLHACLNCRHYDPGAQWECRESSISERVADKEKANFCDFFSPRAGGPAAAPSAQDLLKKAEALFKK